MTPIYTLPKPNSGHVADAATDAMLQLAVGGLRIGVTCDDTRLCAALRTRYAPWLSAGPADCAVTVRCGSGQRMPGRPSPEASFDADRRCRVAAPGYLGMIAAYGGSASLELAAPDVADVDYFLRAVLALLAFERGGLLVHAAGFLRHGQAVLLSGRSGIGKSTSVRVSVGLAHTSALGDDLILLLPQAAGWLAYGTPFWNHETPLAWRGGQTQAGRLAGIFRLVQDTQVRVQPVSPAHIVAGLLSDLPIVPLDTGRVAAVLARLQQIGRAVTTGQLHFRPEPSFWSVIDECIPPTVPS